MNQSCGKCVPCRDGLQEADRLLGSILSGDATEETLTELRALCETVAATADCAGAVQVIRDRNPFPTACAFRNQQEIL